MGLDPKPIARAKPGEPNDSVDQTESLRTTILWTTLSPGLHSVPHFLLDIDRPIGLMGLLAAHNTKVYN